MLRFIIAISILSLLLAACGGKDKSAPPPAANKPGPLRVDAYVVQPQTFAENIEVPGTIIANESTEIHPEVSGRIVQLNLAEGKFVSRGTLLAKLYDEDLQAQLKKLQVQLQIAETNEERSAQLLKIQGISKSDYDASLLNVNNIKADIEIIRTSISRTEIRAPFNGRLGLRNISPGAYVTPASVIAVINQTSELKLDFSVPEKYSAQMKPGKIVEFTYQGSPTSYKAKVTATESGVTETNRSLMVRSIVQGDQGNLLPGTFAKVKLRFDPDPNALLVPTQAVVPQARGKQVIKYEGGLAKFVDVTTGIRDSARIQITEGLKKGDTVIVTGILNARPNAPLAIAKIVE
jgi:membrane fusion protein (multidrug efflux system)